MARVEASKFRLNFRKREEENHIKIFLFDLISSCSLEYKFLLNLDGVCPLDQTAFDIKDGVVSLSEKWLQEKDKEYTIEVTETREAALELIANLEKAINELNSFVANNQYFGKGFTVWNDQKRSLCWLDDNGDFKKDEEVLEFL